MKMRKKKKTGAINFPNGYPYILYSIKNKKEKKETFITAVTIQQALSNAEIQETKRISIEPVSVSEVLAYRGHKKAHDLFAKFGSEWMCKENKVFFKEATKGLENEKASNIRSSYKSQ
jgi:hypothetical protein